MAMTLNNAKKKVIATCVDCFKELGLCGGSGDPELQDGQHIIDVFNAHFGDPSMPNCIRKTSMQFQGLLRVWSVILIYLKIHGQSGILIETTTVIMRILILGLDFKSTQGRLHSCDWVYAGRVQESHAASSTKTHQADARSASRASCKICSSTN